MRRIRLVRVEMLVRGVLVRVFSEAANERTKCASQRRCWGCWCGCWHSSLALVGPDGIDSRERARWAEEGRVHGAFEGLADQRSVCVVQSIADTDGTEGQCREDSVQLDMGLGLVAAVCPVRARRGIVGGFTYGVTLPQGGVVIAGR
jgi:hypothetical protein